MARMVPRPHALLIALSACLALSLPRAAYAGKLDDVERASGPSRERSHDSDSAPSNDDDTDKSPGGAGGSWGGSSSSGSSSAGSSEGAGWFVIGLGYALVMPWLVPRAYDKPCVRGYAAYPDRDGFLRSAAWDEQCAATGETSLKLARTTSNVIRKFAGNAGVEAAYGLGGLCGGNLSAQLLMPYRFDLSVRLQMLADLSERPVDQAIMSQTALGIRFAQNERFAARTGVGLRTFFLNERRLGPDFFYAISVYGRHGLRWEFEAHAGALSHAFAGELRATVGIMLGKTELYGGYSYFHVRGHAGGATLQGPVLGVRLWL